MPFLKTMKRLNSFSLFNEEDFNSAMNNASKFFVIGLFFGAAANIVHVIMWSTLFKICLASSELYSGLLYSDHLVLVFRSVLPV